MHRRSSDRSKNSSNAVAASGTRELPTSIVLPPSAADYAANRSSAPITGSAFAIAEAAWRRRIDGMDVELSVAAAIRGPRATPVALTVNGETQIVDLEPRTSLLDALREHLHLT